jgi:ribonuclease J
VIVDLPGRIFVALFSSNVFRMKSLLDIAAETGRQVVALGRSVDVALQAALRIGAIELPPGVRILSPDEAKQHPDDELLFICTGTQAEPRAALTRLANRDHPRLALKSNDTVIYSARIIPGNEQWVHRVLDELAKQKVRVITPDDAPVHASGHGYREDIRWMIRMIEPQTLVPVHGDYRYQRANAELGRECGIEEQVVLQNGEVVEFTDSGTRVVGLLETGRRVIDGTVFDDIDGNAFRERRQIARAGLVFVNVVADAKGELARAPDIIPVGAFAQDAGDGGQMVDDLRRTVERAWKRISHEDRRDEKSAAEALRILVRRHLRGELDRKPIVIARVDVAG